MNVDPSSKSLDSETLHLFGGGGDVKDFETEGSCPGVVNPRTSVGVRV